MLECSDYPKDHPVWGGRGWKVYLETAEDIERPIRSIERNPLPYNMSALHHSFVDVRDGWDLSAAAR